MSEFLLCPFSKNTFETLEEEQLLKELCIFLERKEQKEATLRKIKAIFPDWLSIEEDMERFVQNKWIRRQDGRYSVEIKILSNEAVANYQRSAKAFLDKFENRKSIIEFTNQWKSVYNYLLCRQIISRINSKELVILEDKYISHWLSFYETESYIYFQFSCNSELDFSSYFTLPIEARTKIPLYKLIGDVSPSYLLDMTGKVLESIMEGSNKTKRKKNIFIEALEMLNYITADEDEYQITCLMDEMKRTELNERTNILNDELTKSLTEIDYDICLLYFITQELMKSEMQNKKNVVALIN